MNVKTLAGSKGYIIFRDKCYKCGKRGHVKRDCDLSRSRSRSRSYDRRSK